MNSTERLLFLASALEADAKNPKGIKFDLERWLKGPDKLALMFWVDPKIPVQNCGTTGCAVGLAMLLPELVADGLTPQVENSRNGRYKTLWPTYETPYAKWEGMLAVAKFFDIDSGQADKFFSPEYYPSNLRQGALAELEVARRIRAYVAARVPV